MNANGRGFADIGYLDRHRHQLGYRGHDVHLDGDQNVMIVAQARHARNNPPPRPKRPGAAAET